MTPKEARILVFALDIVSSTPGLILRCAYTAIAVLLILSMDGVKMDFNAIDMNQFGFDSEYISVMLIAVLIAGTLSYLVTKGLVREKACDNKVASGEIEKPSDLPKDNRYEAMSFAAWICGMALGIYLAPGFIAWATVNAGIWTYVGVSGLFAALGVYVLLHVFHLGVRICLIKAREYAADVGKELKETVSDIQQTATELKKP